MNIVVMSDTHFNNGFSLGKEILERLAVTDLVIHCGDFISREFYDFLNSSKKLKATKGNNDYQLSGILNTDIQFELSGYQFAVTHGHLVPKSKLHLTYQDSDIIIFGHDHHPMIEHAENKIILNPGSLSNNRYIEYNSFMTIDIEGANKPEVKLIKVHQR